MISFGSFIKIIYLMILILLVDALGVAIMAAPIVLAITLATFVNPFMMWLLTLLLISIPFGLSICVFGSHKCMEYIDEVLDR